MRALTILAALALLLLCVQPGQAESQLTFYGGLGYGKILNDGAPDGSIGITGGVMYPLSNMENVSIGGEVGYLMLGKVDDSVCGPYGCFGGNLTWAVIPITGQAWYAVPTEGSMTPLLTAGLGLYMSRVKAEVTTPFGSADDTTSDTDFGLNFGGGLKFGDPEANIKFGGDARFHLVMTEGDSLKVITLMAKIFFG